MWPCYLFLTYLSLYFSFTFLCSLLISDSARQKGKAHRHRKRRRRGRIRLYARMTFRRRRAR
uniref:Ribosomal protein L34 n=1 Tax=Leptobrachium leishanense TaxID=445787 RepID=A0A8C5Q4K4_9ANUR